MYCVYVLKSKINNSYYIGSCKDIVKRVDLHNNGLVKSTKRYRPWKLVYKEGFNGYKETRRREFQIKSWKKRVAIENLIKSRIHDNFGGPMVQR
jgi:putative endonuclease